MAYNRYDQREDRWRGSRARSGEDREQSNHPRSDRGESDDRGFFERAGDEVASWFGDEDAERRRMQDRRSEDRDPRTRGSSWGRYEDDHGRFQGGQSYGRSGRDNERDYSERRWQGSSGESGGFGRGGEHHRRRGGGPRYAEGRSGGMYGGAPSFDSGRQQHGRRDFSQGGNFRPFSGDVGRSDSWQDPDYGGYSPGYESEVEEFEREQNYRPITGDYARSGKQRSEHDPHYSEWRRRQIESLDRDYDDYRQENQSRFENEFSSWRTQRQGKRQLLGQIREHMEVCGSDKQVIGKVDRTAGDKIILTKSDDPSGRHHSIMCSMIDTVEGDKVILNTTADQAKRQWRDESSQRALFEREDQGQSGPHTLNRSFSGTYREE
jgi:hypothetical protein